jgi:hypothetical protein
MFELLHSCLQITLLKKMVIKVMNKWQALITEGDPSWSGIRPSTKRSVYPIALVKSREAECDSGPKSHGLRH